MSLFAKEDPRIFQDVPDSEKLNVVYAYVLKKEREDASKRIWKWFWIGLFVIMTYVSYVQTMKMLQGALGGTQAGGSAFGIPSVGELSKTLGNGGGGIGGLSESDRKAYDAIMHPENAK